MTLNLFIILGNSIWFVPVKKSNIFLFHIIPLSEILPSMSQMLGHFRLIQRPIQAISGQKFHQTKLLDTFGQ